MADSATSLRLPAISAALPGALYQQIADGIKREVSEGRLEPGAPLPSVRRLAEDALVSVITVKRAYEELERDGIIYRRQGLGTFVSDIAADRSRDLKIQRAQELLAEALREGTEAGLHASDVVKLLKRLVTPTRGAPRYAGTRD